MMYYKNLSLDNIICEEDGAEQWATIPEYEGRYSASTLGRIKSLPKYVTLFHGGGYWTKEKILSQRLSGGYLFIALFDGENRLDIQAHIVIGKTFLPNPENKEQINHKKGIKTDNRVSQVEWSTRSENTLHAYANNLMKPAFKNKTRPDMMCPKKVQCLLTGRVMTVRDAAEWLCVKTTIFYNMLSGKVKNWTSFIYY